MADRRDDIARLLSDTPEGLSDGDLARELGAGVRPQTVNALCRRMAAAGIVERIGSRPIRNRLVAPPVVATPALEEPSTEDPSTGEPPTDEPPTDEAPPAETVAEPALAEAHPVDAAPEPAAPRNGVPGPARDVLQAWSRTVNVQAAVASWLSGRGATIRSATVGGTAPARDLVARLDGDEVHVEITGWPPDGDRTHPTTIAADWFSAAARAAAHRRDARPHARIVIALPDTRRYRALTAARGTDLAGARAEVWFVDPDGAVDRVAPGRAAVSR